MTIYCPNFKLLYLEMPRTATNSTSKLLRDHYGGIEIGRKHMLLKKSLEILKTNAKEVFKITTVRNPFDSMYSKYCKYKNYLDRKYPKHQYKDYTFNKFILEPIDNIKHFDSIFTPFGFSFKDSKNELKETVLKQFGNFLTPKDNDLGFFYEKLYKNVDEIIKYENLQDGFDRVMEKVGVNNKYKIPKINVTKKPTQDYLSQYTPEMLRLVYFANKEYCDNNGYALSFL